MTKDPGATTTADATDPAPRNIPPSYWMWLSGITVSLFGSQVMLFGLGWTATAHGGALAGLVLTASTVPRLALALVGGAVADRHSPWPVMIAADIVMLVTTAFLAIATHAIGSPVFLLLAVAMLLGTADAFYTPASSTMPRMLVSQDNLGRAMAARQMVGQLASTLGPPVGGIAVALTGLAGVSLINAISFGCILLVLLRIRPRTDSPQSATAEEPSLLSRAWDGLRISLRDKTLRSLLLLVAVTAGCLLPVTSLLIPLMARENGWPATIAGEIVGSQALGAGIVAVLVLMRSTSKRPGLALASGLLLAGLGALTLGHAPSPL